MDKFVKVFKIPYNINKKILENKSLDFNEAMEKTERVQDLDRFDDCYTDIVDYIIRCTHRIWQENNVGLLYSHYAKNVEINIGSIKENHGVDDTLSNTMQRLHSMPNRKGIVQNVIWSGNASEGFYTSHRGISIGNNMGDTVYGPGRGKKFKISSVADCESIRNKITKEWLIRDNLYFVSQLGYNPREMAVRLVREQKARSSSPENILETSAVTTGHVEPTLYIPEHQGNFDIGDFILEFFNKIHQRKLIGCVKHFYADNANLHFVCDKDLIGFHQIRGMLISFYSSFPKAQITVERVTCNQIAEADDWDVAVRWRISGLNEGLGYFGSPSDNQVEILIVNHFKILSGKIIEEWMLFDGMDVLKQMYK